MSYRPWFFSVFKHVFLLWYTRFLRDLLCMSSVGKLIWNVVSLNLEMFNPVWFSKFCRNLILCFEDVWRIVLKSKSYFKVSHQLQTHFMLWPLGAMHRVSTGEGNSTAQGRGVDSTDDSSLEACLKDILLQDTF